MSPFTKLLQAIEVSRQQKADEVIRRYKHLIAPKHVYSDVLPEATRQTIEPRSKHVISTSQLLFSETHGVMQPINSEADIGDAALPLPRPEIQGRYNHTGTTVVAGAWLVLFIIAMIGFEFEQVVTDVLASLY